jgi:hypothetical protein
MFDRIDRSFKLTGQCLRVLADDPALLIFPLLCGISVTILTASLMLPLLVTTHLLSSASWAHSPGMFGRTGNGAIFAYFVFYFGNYLVVLFFNTALVAVALERLRGREASVGYGLSVAVSRLPALVGYAVIAATVGMILRMISERVGFIGRIVVGLIGFTWTTATALAVPVLAAEGVGPINAIERSTEMLKRTWGENILGNGGIGIVSAMATVATVLVSFLLFAAALAGQKYVAAFGVASLGVLAVITCTVISSTLHAIYSAALYRFGSGEGTDGAIDPALLSAAFRSR